MLMSEWIRVNLVEPAKERRREEGRVEGRKEGRVQGHEEGRVEGHAEGREEARAELMAEFEDWDTRRRAAEERGEFFDEPPPYARNGASDNHN